ncbi:MAG: adenosylcobinamide-GDP ribazoletransferase [Thioalkalivibrio sp.]|jgi:adenosylcobinamide-GDP ribazoletransferase|nr:adenosylcobinamide-GDP ribazoletransferase [Thioalkalivibrio sp.]NBB94756.1 adenosylcobinamide-GDP ribazoletransferase [Planctomycetota bacterium]
MRSLLAAFAFLTVVPVPVRLAERDFARAPFGFPLVGMVLGTLVALSDLGLDRLGLSPAFRGILAVGLLAALSGGLHLDGLADAADGFLSARPRKRVLEIMRDPHIGTMGVLALVFVLAVKVAALVELPHPMRWKALVFAPLAGRCMLVSVMALLPYVRGSEGLATVFYGPHRRLAGLWAAVCVPAAAILLLHVVGGLLLAGSVFAITGVLSLWSWRRIGGLTGDTLGATSEIIEAAVLLFASVV